MSKTIHREPEAVRPWQQVKLRPTAPKTASSVLAGLTDHSDGRCEGVRGRGGDSTETGAPAAESRPRPLAPHEAADQLLQEAREEADRLRAAAAREGFADGQAQALEELAEERQRLRELLSGIPTAYHDFCLSQAPELAALAAMAAEALLLEQLSLEPQRVLAIVQQAIEQVAGAAPISVHLNPSDVALVRADLLNDPRRSAAVQLAPDPAVEPGGCWIESARGEVDATVSGRLERLRDMFG